MVNADLMADQIPSPDSLPTWLVAALSVLTALAGQRWLTPLARWAGKRLDLVQQARVAERTDLVRQLTRELSSAREEMIELRLEVAQEREQRMKFAVENAMLTERVDGLTTKMAEDKAECQLAIRGLRAEIARLQRQREGRA